MRKLFWIGEEKDGSLYAQPYLSVRMYKSGSFVVPSGGKVHISYSDGEFTALNRKTKVKISFHPSGQIHSKTQDIERERLWLIKHEELYKIDDCKQLAVILPKESESYPIIEKDPDEGDIILPSELFDHRPFVIELYLAKKSFDPNALFSKNRGASMIVVWQNKLRLILIAYQTEQTRKQGNFPPKEHWLFKR